MSKFDNEGSFNETLKVSIDKLLRKTDSVDNLLENNSNLN